jgi:hypothetical protein
MPADSGRRQATQFLQLQTMLPAMYADKQHPVPVLIGPDSHGVTDPLTKAFVSTANQGGLNMHAITYHEYLGESALRAPAATLVAKLSHPSLSDLRSITGAKAPTQLWVGEAGGCAGGGSPGLTDSYASGRWWLASLGVHALNGVSVFCRQDIAGGNYGVLIDDFPWNLPLNASTRAEKVSTCLSHE